MGISTGILNHEGKCSTKLFFFHSRIFPLSIGFSLHQSLALKSRGSTEERHLILDCMDTSGLSWARLVRFSWESWAGPNLIPSDTIPQKWNMEFRMSGLCLCQQHDLHRPKFLSSRYSCKSSFAINTLTHTQPELHVRALCCSCRHIVILLCQTRMIEMFVNLYCVSLQQHNTDFHLEIVPSGWNDLSFSCLMIL